MESLSSLSLHPTSQSTTDFPKLITIEGNIGVGKTYLGTELAKSLGYKVMLEPVAKNPYLEKFYADPKQYALKLQIWIYRQRYRTYIDAVHHIITTGQGVILDRSVFSDVIFADANLLEGNISREGYDHYIQLRTQSLSKLPWPHITVVLLASPELCSSRIAQRSRSCESSIPLAYLKLLHAGHTSFMQDMQTSHSKLVCMDWTSFGTAAEVLKQVESASAVPWPEDVGRTTLLMARTEALIVHALFVPNAPTEAIIDDDVACNETILAAEKILHEQERSLVEAKNNVGNTSVTSVETDDNDASIENLAVPSSTPPGERDLKTQVKQTMPESSNDGHSQDSQSKTKRRLFSQSQNQNPILS
eukprot:m.42340 g.42340  ORF g.42340 m.42340 type:complete len:361 (-) comp19079_c0_seq1:561-1643(-)